MVSIAPAAQASRSHSPWQMVTDLADVGHIGEPSGVLVWESRGAGGKGTGNRGLEGIGTRMPTMWRRKGVFAVCSQERQEPCGGTAWSTR
jgi:hypothetical protein